ncbi:MAG: DUF58 domain-containing protein [Halobacteriota archaeon]
MHWKTSAKRDDLIVKEFAADTDSEAVSIAAGAAPGREDDMAEAVASIGLSLLSASVPIEVATPTAQLSVGVGEHRFLLEHLAAVTNGRLPNADADIVIRATDAETRVSIRDWETTLSWLTGEESRAASESERADEEASQVDAATNASEVTA